MKSILLIIFLLSNITFASIGTISSFKGSVKIQRDTQNIRAILGLKIEKNDIINTKDNSNIIITFNDNTVITVGKNSTLSIEEYTYDEKNIKNSKTNFNFLKGTFKSVSGIIGKINPEKFKLHTKTANIGIRGTTVIANQEIVACTSGYIQVSTQNKTLSLSKNQYTKTEKEDGISTPLTLNTQILTILYEGLAQDFETEKLELLKTVLDKATTNIKKQREGGNTNESSREEDDHP